MTSLTLTAVVMTLSGVPRPSQIRCSLPVFRRSTGDGPVSAPAFRADVGAVHARAGPVEFAGRVQLREQNPVQPVEDYCFLPPLQTPPAGLPRAEPHFQGQELPGHVVIEDEQDALEAELICHRSWPRDRSGHDGSNGSNGSISAHNSSSTIHGRVPTPRERPNPHTGYAPPARFNKIVLRALSGESRRCPRP